MTMRRVRHSATSEMSLWAMEEMCLLFSANGRSWGRSFPSAPNREQCHTILIVEGCLFHRASPYLRNDPENEEEET